MNIPFSVFLIGITLLHLGSTTETKCNLWQGKCPPGWKTFVRPPSTRICLRIFHQNATYLQAQEVCRKQYNSRIHGVANVEEHSWLKMKAKQLITENPGYMWLGARRKSFCYKTPADLAKDPMCSKKNDMFKWDDQLTKQNFLFTQWDPYVDAPNGVMSNNAPEDCVVMNVHDHSGYIDDKESV
uniref:C-type lectin domain-containing protein n=1 Tax=Caenorhabditis tropicalis TaxID=1561998 RepID=A0A1I7TSD1_9PELO